MRIYSLLLLLLLPSCTITPPVSRPALHEVTYTSHSKDFCSGMFVQKACELVHSITFTMENGYGATLLGVIAIDGGKIKATLMGVEGFVLFAADQDEDKTIRVHKSLPPFDKPGFAEGLMRDVRTLFIIPEYVDLLLGETGDHETVCRYMEEDGRVLDVIAGEAGYRRIVIYDAEGKREQLVRAKRYKAFEGVSLAESIELTSFGVGAYTLQLNLLRAEKSQL